MSWPESEKNQMGKSRRHSEVAARETLKSTLRAPTPAKYQIVYADVTLPTGSSRIFGILHEGKVYGRVTAFAHTGVYPNPQNFKPLSERDYNVYKQWLVAPGNSKTKRTAESMQWIEDHAEQLVREGQEKEKKYNEGQNAYERSQKLSEEYRLPVSALKVGNVLEFQFDKSLWTVTKIKDGDLFAIENAKPDYAERFIGAKGIVEGYKLVK